MRRSRLGAALVGLAWLPGCYTYVPVASPTPPVGSTVALEINDVGRVGLAERLGTSVRRIEGRLVGTDGDQYLVSVSRIASIDGETSSWSGETVRLQRGFVGAVRERELSKSRSWLAAGVATGILVVLVTQTNLGGFFTGDDDDGGPDTGTPSDLRGRRP